MHQRSLSELQGVSTQRTTQDQASRSSGLCPPRVAPLWAWLLLSALVVPGAWSFLSEEQEELLVELHNHYRGLVSPSASAMLPLKWDLSLKVLAEGYATKCVWNHNPELEDTGENLYAGTGALDLREALEKWFLEYLDYDFHNNSCDEDKMCGHYTQMVWADTHRVGCAFHLCNSMEGLDWERVSFLVCNYYPAGNYEDERPYVEGDWCSRCPENLQRCENNLCVPDTVEDEEDMDEEEEWGTPAPPTATSDPSLQLEEEENEEEKVVPSLRTTDVQPAPTSTPALDTEDNPLPDTPDPGTPPPEVPSTTLVEEEKVGEKMGEEEEEKEKEKEEEKGNEEKMRKETKDKMEGEREKDVAGKTHHNVEEVISSTTAGLVSSLSLLVACLTGVLTLRL